MTEPTKEQKYQIKFNKFRSKLEKAQAKLNDYEKQLLYKESLKAGNLIGLHILNHYVDLDFGLIEF